MKFPIVISLAVRSVSKRLSTVGRTVLEYLCNTCRIVISCANALIRHMNRSAQAIRAVAVEAEVAGGLEHFLSVSTLGFRLATPQRRQLILPNGCDMKNIAD
jgi:hypothetical protein